MNEMQPILKELMDSLRRCKTCITDGIDATFGAKLRVELQDILKELDLIESDTVSRCASVQIHFDSLPALPAIFRQMSNRLRLHFRNTDSEIAESMICCCNQSMIRIQRIANSAHTDLMTSLLLHRFLGCLAASVRSLQHFL